LTTHTSKAGLVSALKEVGIPIPKDSRMTSLRHRLRYWRPGKGWLMRLIHPPSRKPHTPATLLEVGTVYWMPNSRMASDIIKTKLVFVLGRETEPPNNATPLDVPEDYNKRWPLGWDGEKNGGNNDTDS